MNRFILRPCKKNFLKNKCQKKNDKEILQEANIKMFKDLITNFKKSKSKKAFSKLKT